MAIVFRDCQGILIIDYVTKGSTVTRECYASLMRRFRESIKVKGREKRTKGVLLLHDIAPVHTSRVSKAAIAECNYGQSALET